MPLLKEQQIRNLLLESARFRGQGNYKMAIRILEERLGDINEDYILNAYLEIIYAAQEDGNSELARKYAELLQQTDPDLPTVVRVLG